MSKKISTTSATTRAPRKSRKAWPKNVPGYDALRYGAWWIELPVQGGGVKALCIRQTRTSALLFTGVLLGDVEDGTATFKPSWHDRAYLVHVKPIPAWYAESERKRIELNDRIAACANPDEKRRLFRANRRGERVIDLGGYTPAQILTELARREEPCL